MSLFMPQIITVGVGQGGYKTYPHPGYGNLYKFIKNGVSDYFSFCIVFT
jgi:hypothetical protein